MTFQKISFSRERSLHVLSLLVRAIDAKAGVVAETADLVENQVPTGIERGSLAHALFLFAIVPCDRGVKSSSLWTRAKRLFESDPWLFEPRSFADYAHLLDVRGRVHQLMLNNLKPRYANAATDGLLRNSARLYREFGSDARSVFSSGSSGAEAYRAIRSFVGFGPKTGGMMYRAAVGLGWSSALAAEDVEIPVDTHDVRIAWQLGILISTSPPGAAAHQRLAPSVRRELTAACRELGVDWFDIDRAMWLIGSRGCSQGRCFDCPLRTECIVGREQSRLAIQGELKV